MKPFILSFLLIIVSTSLFAQADGIKVWNKYSANADTPLLFAAANNVIEIYSPAIKPADLSIKCIDYTLKCGTPEIKGDTIAVMAMPHATGERKMRLAIINKTTGKTIKTISFYSAAVPTPVAQLGKITTTAAMRKDLLDQQMIKVVFPESLYSYPYKVTGYTFKVKYSQINITRPIQGNMIPVDILQEIKNAPDNAVIEFTDIKATCPECGERALDDLRITIK